MKKLAFVLSFVILIAVASVVIVSSAPDKFDHDEFKLMTAERVSIETDTSLSISLDFYLPQDAVDYLIERGERVTVLAVMQDYESDKPVPTLGSGTGVEVYQNGTISLDDTDYAKYTFDLGVILPENYSKSYAIRAFVKYTLNGEDYEKGSDYTVKNNVITPYERVYDAFSDRSETKTETHPYEAEDGSFVSVADLNALRKILSAVLYIEIKDGVAKDVRENEFYKSLYDIEYFDGVLTLSIGNTDFPEWLLCELYINGEARYFEIYNGKIKLVV